MAYAGYYLCRNNFNVVMPLLERQFGFTNMQLAGVIFGYSLFYALGQFCSGILSDHFGPRKVVAIGLAVVVVANLLMGFQTTLLAFGLLVPMKIGSDQIGQKVLFSVPGQAPSQE